MASPYRVLLPKTPFPMKADLPAREPAMIERWTRLDIDQRRLKKNTDSPPFVLHDGPPYANGPIHMGHALNKILKDIVVKYKSLRGFRAPFIPGWDCHGLPIEHQLLKELGLDKNRVDPVAFRQQAARYAARWIDVQRDEFKRLGILADWDHPYRTMDPSYESAIAKTFYDLYAQGRITRHLKPVHWCPSCETALAEAEVEYRDKQSPSITVAFPVTQWPTRIHPGRPVAALVWTTTPWTLPANTALAFHPEGRYRLWLPPDGGDGWLVGDPGWALLESRHGPGPSDPPCLTGAELEGLAAQNPLNGRTSRGVLGDFVSSAEGTGIVHIAPGHGEEDHALGLRYGLPVLSPVDDQGRFTGDVSPPELAGVSVWSANRRIIEQLTHSGRLWGEAAITHSYPHCWRCHEPVLFRATRQWFFKVTDDFRAQLLNHLGEVTWIPAYGRDRMRGMIETRPDWCLSRQRHWGAPVPMFHCDSCGRVLNDSAVFDRVVSALSAHGSAVWFEKDPAFFGADIPCPDCGHTRYRKETDILDVWFDSGVSWAAVLARRPDTRSVNRADVMYLEGSDQHRGWFQTSLLPAAALTGHPPYGAVLTHGFVLDGQGRAMSKSQGNVIAPQELVRVHGADIVRLWVSVTDYRDDVRLSDDILRRVVDTYRKIRNTLRFLLGNLADFVPARHALALDRWEPLDLAAIAAWNDTLDRVTRHYDRHEFHLVTAELCDALCINTLSEYYLDVRKDILYCDPADSPRRRAAQTALWHMARGLARALAPLLSFTAEEAWQTLHGQGLLSPDDDPDSVFLNPFPKPVTIPTGCFYPMGDFLRLRRAVNAALEKARQAGAVKSFNDASVPLFLHEGLAPFAAMTPDDLAATLGVAHATVTLSSSGEPFEVRGITPAPGSKCSRCWMWRSLTGGLCARCHSAEAGGAAPA